MKKTDLNRIDVIRASAGTGKTFRLASEFVDKLAPSPHHTIEPDTIIATTFTNKASRELSQRVRQQLIKTNQWTAAQSVLGGHLGTVNSICGRMLTDLAIEAGISPSIDVIAEGRQNDVFSTAVEDILSSYASIIWPAANRLNKHDWRNDVLQIVELTRQNDIRPNLLSGFAETSWQRILQLLPAPLDEEQAGPLNANLLVTLKSVVRQLESSRDEKKITATALEFIRETARELASAKEISWQSWAKLAKIKVSRSRQLIVQPLTEAASFHSVHPQLHDDIRTMIFAIFNCAAECLFCYQQFKQERGLIDFVDQEQLALHILRQPELTDLLRDRYRVLLVDEFQDTSPIQLAVFLQLARLVDTAVWVGDEKQSIFGFRGADPELMSEITGKLVPMSGGKEDKLDTSYRSRSSLVKFVNHVFRQCAHLLSVDREFVEVFTANRIEHSEMNDALHFWWLDGQKANDTLASLGVGVFDVLSDRESWKVFDKVQNTIRRIRGSDIAILCRTNDQRLAIAQSLSRAGLTVATERDGLLDTPECVLAVAALRYLVDRYDTLAIAEIIRLTSSDPDLTEWLSTWLKDGYQEFSKTIPCLLELDQVRKHLEYLSPMETLELAITAGGVCAKIKRWGRPRQRILNLDALRGLAKAYQELCATRRSAATAAGFITFLYRESKQLFQPANPDDDAIQVLTYHKAKGLEWPMVIMCDLDTPVPASPFGVCVEQGETALDPMDPLRGRRIRYWPWPYGLQRTGMPLQSIAAQSYEMSSAAKRSMEENLRLLYVGMTRARDYLVLSSRPTPGGTGWLDIVASELNEQVFSLPYESGRHEILKETNEVVAVVRIFDGSARICSSSVETPVLAIESDSQPTTESAPYRMTPSALLPIQVGPDGNSQIKRRIDLGGRLSIGAVDDMRILGEAFHSFLSAVDFSDERETRLSLAGRITANWNLRCFDPETLVICEERFRNQVEKLYPASNWLRECRVSGRHAKQRVRGSIDLLIETALGFVIIDHKTFPGRYESWDQKAIGCYPQLKAYGELVKHATNRSVIGFYVYMPVVGVLLELS